MNELHRAWAKQEHAAHFDSRSRFPGFVLVNTYERFNEVRLLNETMRRHSEPCHLLEVGCATGEFYRYLSLRHPNVTYTGCDISKPALERARQKYPAEGRFLETDVDLKSLNNANPDIVFCRDVAHHQPDPLALIRKLYAMAKSLTVMRIRTRDVGPTVYDPALSCQLSYGEWVPYIVLNSKELLGRIKEFSPRPSRIVLVKHYMVLGGQHARHLPKECYFNETLTAESALLIEKRGEGGECEVVEEASAEHFRLGLLNSVLVRLASR